MDYFGAQDHARRKTWQLAALFAAAVASLVLLTNLLIGAVYTWAARPARTGGVDLSGSLADLPAGYWAWVSFGVVAVVALASGYKYLQVRSGGRAVAESLGGTPVHPASADFAARRLLNVVEEMAIASGTPVPPVYLVDQPSINAFAAGFGPDDAIIGVNRGTLDHLTRDELQGVVAHEFSHLLNGDSRLNLRLIAVLHGILFIGLVGRGLLSGIGRMGMRRSRSNSGGAGGLQGLLLGVGLVAIGYAGTFFGNLIKAAVSRQREYLADAASVQFTRNPGGIAGALKKIGGLAAGSRVRGAAAAEASHLFFGQVSPMFLNRLMATHPPLEKRIRAVEPSWNGRFPAISATGLGDVGDPAVAGFATVDATPGTAGPPRPAGDALQVHASPEEVTRAVGRLDAAALEQAGALLHALPAALRDAAHDPFSARALLYALVFDHDPAARRRQSDVVAANAERGIAAEVASLLPQLEPLDAQHRLTLAETAIPALKTLSSAQYRTFTANLVALIKADRHIDMLEWVLHRLLVKELRPHFEGRSRPPARHVSLDALSAEAGELLSALAREGDDDPVAAARAFAAGQAALGTAGTLEHANDPDFQRLNRALTALRAVKPLQKPRLIKACAATVLADGHVSAREGALLKGVAAALDCPLPPSIYQSGADVTS